MKAMKIGQGAAVDGAPFDLVLRASERRLATPRLNPLTDDPEAGPLLDAIFERLDALEAVLEERASHGGRAFEIGLALAINRRWLPSLHRRKGPQRS